MSVKNKLLAFLQKPEEIGRNTFSIAQAKSMFRISNVAARIHELRQDGWPIYTNVRYRSDGTPVAVYRMGKPSRSMKRSARAKGIRLQKVA